MYAVLQHLLTTLIILVMLIIVLSIHEYAIACVL